MRPSRSYELICCLRRVLLTARSPGLSSWLGEFARYLTASRFKMPAGRGYEKRNHYQGDRRGAAAARCLRYGTTRTR